MSDAEQNCINRLMKKHPGLTVSEFERLEEVQLIRAFYASDDRGREEAIRILREGQA